VIRRILVCAFLFSVFSIITSVEISARDPELITKNSEGKEFWVCFMKNFREGQTGTQNRPDKLKLQLFITSSNDAKVRVEVEDIGFNQLVEVKANTVVNVVLPERVQLRALETPERLAVHITSDTAIAVYGLNSRFQTTDTYMGLPVSVLGTAYRAVGYTKLAADLLSAISVIAIEDSTEIEITPNATTSTGRRLGVPFKVRLRRGEVYSINARFESIGPCDLTGSLITANKKIAVFSGHQCAYVPPKVDACNHLVEQLPPISAWGMHYYLGMLKERSRYTYRVIGSEDGTRVFEDAKLVAVLRKGEFFENLNVNRHIQVTADKPVLVAQYAQGFKNGDSVGDPMMILVSPTQQFLSEYRFATPINGDWHHYVNVVAPTNSIENLRLNGRRIDSSEFKVLGESRYSIAQISIPFGTHVIQSLPTTRVTAGTDPSGAQGLGGAGGSDLYAVPFGLYSYGFGFKSDAYDAYGNMAGQSFFELKKLVDTLPPVAEGRKILDDFLVVLRDDRTTDRGMKSVKVLYSASLAAQVPKVEEGTPQVAVRIRPSSQGTPGRIVLNATDIAGNESEFTVCYVFDSRSERYAFIMSEGRDVECASEGAWMVGAFVTAAHTFHETNFKSTGGVIGQSVFTPGQGFAGGGGVLLGRRISPTFIATARLSLNVLGGTMISADTVQRGVFDTLSQQTIPYQEGTTLSVSAPYLNLGFAAEWFPIRFFYLLGGLQGSMALGSSVEVVRTIVQPSNFTFEDGSRSQKISPESLSSLSGFNAAAFAGIGFTYPVTFKMSVFLEGQFTQPLGNVITDGEWTNNVVGINLGARYRW